MTRLKASNEQLIESYAKTQSIWGTAKAFNMCGQSVWERLKKLNRIKKRRFFSDEEKKLLLKEYNKYKKKEELDKLAVKMSRTKQLICRQANRLELTTRKGKNVSDRRRKIMSLNSERWHKENEHPRGMKGKTHTEKVKKKASERIKRLWADPKSKFNSPESRQKRSDAQSKRMIIEIKNGVNLYSRCKRGWWKDGNRSIFMRSGWEAYYADYLNFLWAIKEIKKWDYEADTFWFDKIKSGIRSYTPDFKITNNNGTIEYHEVKGWMDKKSKTKLSRMKKYYPKIKLVIIGKDRIKALKKQFSSKQLIQFYKGVGGSAVVDKTLLKH